MKKNRLFLLWVLLSAGLAASSQSIQRNMVVLEIGTGTWCQYCPGASNAADQLITEGKNVAVIENHNGDPYANAFSNTRNSYYAVSGYPSGFFDGIVSSVGGAACPSGNIYSTYLPMYQQRYAAPAPIAICFSGSNTGNNYTVNVSVTKLNSYTGNNLKLQLVLTESHIPVTWMGCMSEVNFVNRLMVPGSNGTSVNFAANPTQTYTLSFVKDPSWDLAHCELVAFVQDSATKEIFNGIKSPLNALPATLFSLNDFAANQTSGCAPLTVNFTTTQPSNVSYTWSFEAGNPSTSTQASPSVAYASSGSYDVMLSGNNGQCYDTRVKANYISPLAAPDAPGMPAGSTGLCTNPVNQTYTSTTVPYANAFVWDLAPAAAGVLTWNGPTCTIDWNNSWTGVATLKMKCTNSCGSGNWSEPLTINVDAIPGQCPMPAGATSLCANAATTHYTTTGIVPSTYYMWELTPATAGAFFQGSSAIDIDWADDFAGTATLRVKANNGNCEGSFSDPLPITINSLPAACTVNGGGTYCGPSGTGLPVGLSSSQASTSYTLYRDGIATSTVVNGTGNAITFGNQLTAGNYTVQASNTSNCGSTMTGNALIAVDPQAPVKPSDPAGPSVIITTETPTSQYVTQSTYASTYSWDLAPAVSGSVSGTASTALVTWNQGYIGTSVIKVQGVNTCGSSTYSNEVSTSVNIGVGLAHDAVASLITLSPNPAQDRFSLHSPTAFRGSLSVVNSVGERMIYIADMEITGETKTDISRLAPGIYTIVLANGQGQASLRLVKQ
ncbi:MAG: Omp28-related outer membrane protein [Bacteroidota bacterium]